MKTEKDFQSVFTQLKTILKEYEPATIVKVDEPGNYSLDAANAPTSKGVFFGSVAIKKNYVSFYLMPVYVYPDLLDGISERLRKRMQGKSCFNFTALDPDTLTELSRLTRAGVEKYKAERLA
jgi:hypothetical protein